MPTRSITKIGQFAQDATIKLRVRSAVNPILWLCGIGCPLCFGFGLAFTGPLQTALVWAGIGLLICGAGSFMWLMFKDPDRLQSEDYQLRRVALDLIQEKGGALEIEATSVEAITNPQLPMLSVENPENAQ